ncbi:MAG TPA: hypothetical protein VFQ67_00725 [Allosphingosinicella sp.]|jgi:hypothetical protein|nr:hypothetical protein [Allosphingosinicella sp.]
MRAWATTAACVLLLTACEDGAPEREVTRVVAANPYSDQLKALSEPTRHLGLYRALRDNGQRCKRVDRGEYQQQYKTMAMWTAHCTDTGDYALYIAPNGDVQVSACRDARELRLPECKAAAAPAQPGEASEKR